MLIILGGLPGTGKTTIARELARQLGAVHVRIDSIEEAVLDSGVLSSPINDAGYRVGYAVAADNLRIGRTVIADSVNPIPLSRDAWVEVANRAQVSAVEIEVICSPLRRQTCLPVTWHRPARCRSGCCYALSAFIGIA
jgi:predicted kinase